MATVKVTHFGLQANTDRTVYVTWTWSKSYTENYKVKWWYATGDGIWFVGNESETKDKQSTYNAPQNAMGVRVMIKPISKKRKVNKKEVSYWTADWSTAKVYKFSTNPPATPPVPTVTIDDYKLTAKLSNVDKTIKQVQFQIVKNDSSVYKSGTVTVKTSAVSYSCTLKTGTDYKVRCRGKNSGGEWGDWSEYSDTYSTKPSAPSKIISCKAKSETTVELSWSKSSTAVTYDIEHATEKDYLGASNGSTVINNIETTTYIITGLESGKKYYFRVRAVNDKGTSEWTSAKSTSIGTKPEPPTTWSTTTTAVVGDEIIFYWIHNSEDNSDETDAKIEITANGETETITIGKPEEGSDENRSYKLDTSIYAEGTTVEWRIRTKGAINTWSDWSVKRTIDVYAPPVVDVMVTDYEGTPIYTLLSYPFDIKATTGPVTQTPIGYHVIITANDSYETWDEIGNFKMVTKGEEVYSKFYDTNSDLYLRLTPDSVDLHNNVIYTVKCIASMDTGLTAESTTEFEVAWDEPMYSPDAEMGYDSETLCVHIRPYCEIYPMTYYEVEYDADKGEFYRTEYTLHEPTGVVIPDSYTEEYGDVVYYGRAVNSEKVYFCIAESSTPIPVENISLSVYRREYDGRFIEIASGLSNDDNTFVTDPHPALDYARYRVVAVDNLTGSISYTDIPGYMVGEKSVIIQWDEVWSAFESTEEQQEKPAWSGSMLKLPFNIDVSDSNDMDVTLIKYIGRSHPVSYYGTQLGSSATWNVEIDKADKNTLYGLRRLAIYTGDVYVREPSGSGYWANISVSFTQTHCQLTIPVTLNVTRVEGGI